MLLKWLFVTRESLATAVPILKMAAFLLDRRQEVYVVSKTDPLGPPTNSNGIPLLNYSTFHHFELNEPENHGRNPLKFAQNYFRWLLHYNSVIKAIQNKGIDIVIFYNPQLLPLVVSCCRRSQALIGYYAAELTDPSAQPHYL